MSQINSLYSLINKKIIEISQIKVLTLIVFLTIFFHFPSRFDRQGENYSDQKIKSENLLTNAFQDRNSNSHSAKLETRILIPIAIKLFDLNRKALIFISLFSGVFFLWCIYFYFNFITDKVNSFWITLAISNTYVGSNGFVETRFMFDSLSLGLIFFGFLITEIIRPRFKILLSTILIFAAMINDERSIFTVFGMILLSLIYCKKNGKFSFIFSSVYGLVFYIIFRLVLSHHFKVNTPVDGVGLTLLLSQLNNIKIGYLMFFEGFIILIYYWLKCFLIPTYYVGGGYNVGANYNIIEQLFFYFIGRY